MKKSSSEIKDSTEKFVASGRGSTSLGDSQGDHVTAYAVVEKAIKNAVEELTKNRQGAQKEINDGSLAKKLRKSFLNKVKMVLIVLGENSGAVESEIEELVVNYEERRNYALGNVHKLDKFLNSEEENFDSEKREVFDFFSRDAFEAYKEKIHNEMVLDVGRIALSNFNRISGLVYEKNPKYPPAPDEGSRIRKALSFFSDLEKESSDSKAEEKISVHEMANSNPKQEGRGSKRAASQGVSRAVAAVKSEGLDKSYELLQSVYDTFFYPKYADQDISSDSDGISSRNNSPELLQKYVARHIILLEISYPVLEKEFSKEVFAGFTNQIAKDWKISDVEKFKEGVTNELGILRKNFLNCEINITDTPQQIVQTRPQKTYVELKKTFGGIKKLRSSQALKLLCDGDVNENNNNQNSK